MDIVKRFSNYLDNVEYPKEKTSWNIAGNLKSKNAFYKYDVREMFVLPKGGLGKHGRTDSKADKMVFELIDQWVIIDMEELINYIKLKKLRKVHLDDLISKLDWNIILPKN
tara:strand:+ start:196 stop:528 length:333 start_codon:yes stop_codon:yes gene_type:complete